MDLLGTASASRARYDSALCQMMRQSDELEDKLMRFWKRTDAHHASADEVKKADRLEAYTCWLKNEKLSRKQKRILKELPSCPDFQALKQLVDFTHYRFEERATVTPRPGAKESARARLMAEIRGEEPEQAYAPAGSAAPVYGPEQMGNQHTDVMPPMASVPTDEELNWGNKPSERIATPYNAIRTLSRMHLRFEQKDDDLYLTDMGSSTATYVEGERVEDTKLIHDNATVECGKVTLKVVNIQRS